MRTLAKVASVGLLLTALISTATPARAQDRSAASDPYIVKQATALQNDVNQIFAFVRDQIAFEAYNGSVRGARGTLWSKAGNTLDKASLLVALLGAAGVSAQYEHGVLNDPSALIRRMFPTQSQFIGCVPFGGIIDDPGFNGFAQSDSRDYYWVQYGAGIDLDPNQPGAQPGHAILTPDSSFTVVPQNLRQQVTIKMTAELYSQAFGLFGQGPGTTTVFSKSFDTSALVGKIVSAGNFVQSSAGGALDVTATTFTYTPYILLGSGGPDVSQDQVFLGTDYQEIYTNFPLGSSILTGLFLEIDAIDLNYTQRAFTRTIFDRLGPAARQGLSTVQVVVPPSPSPAVTGYDIATVNILPSRQSLDAFTTQQTRLNNAYQNYLAVKPQLAGVPTTGPLTAAQQAIVQKALTLGKYLLIAENELVTMGYNGAADQLTGQLQTGYDVRIYPVAPRLTVAQSSFASGSNGAVQYRLDVLKNDMRVIGGVGQARTAPYYAEVTRGILESLLEGQVLTSATGQAAAGIGEVLAALQNTSQLTVLGNHFSATDINQLDATQLSADAKALIANALTNNLTVISPTVMVTINGSQTVGWFETDQNGHTISHFADGGHQAIVEWAMETASVQKYNEKMSEFIGKVEGVGLAGIVFAAGVVEGVANGTSFSPLVKNAKATMGNVQGGLSGASQLFTAIDTDLKTLESTLANFKAPNTDNLGLLFSYAGGLADGLEFGIDWLKRNLPKDPPVLPFIGTPLGPGLPGVSPSGTPSVQVNVGVDPYFTTVINGLELPLTFLATVTNTGPATDTFNIGVSNNVGFFSIYPSVSSLTLQPGQVGQVNICTAPFDSLGLSVPPAGSAFPFDVTVTSATNPSVTSAAHPSFSTPTIPTLNIAIDPAAITVSPGATTTPVTLTLSGAGNAAPGSVSLSAAPPAGVTVNGLTTPVTVPLNGVTTEAVTFTAAANAAIANYDVPITASFTAGGSTQQVVRVVPLSVMTVGQCAVQAATSALQIGKQALSTTLQSLGTDMNAAAANPANAGFVSRVVSDVQYLVTSNLDVTFLQSQNAALTAAATAVAQSTPANLLTALGTLNTALCSLNTVVNRANTFNTQLALTPSGQVTAPQTLATFGIDIANYSTTLQVYDLSVTGVPAGVTAQFSQPSITLGPFNSPTYFSTSVTLTLTPGASFTTPFGFNVIATPRGAPEQAKTAVGSLSTRPEVVSVDNVTATPAFGNPGTMITASARVFAAVNQARQSYLQMVVLDSNNHAVTFPTNSNLFTLTTTSTLQTVSFNPLDTTNLTPGAYVLSIQAFDVSNGLPILGASGSGAVLIGSPLSATLTATPPTVPPGSSTVQAKLALGRDTVQNPVSTLLGLVQVNGAATKGMVLYQNGGQALAYVCTDAYVNIVDVTNPSSPTVLGTFAHDLLTANAATGFTVVSCGLYNNQLLLGYSRENGNHTANPIPTHFAVFSLANPLSPTEEGSVIDILKPDSAGFYVLGNTGLLFQNDVLYNPFSNFIFQQNGDVWAMDLTNASTGQLTMLGDLYPCGVFNPSTQQCTNTTAGIPNDQYRGGPYRLGSGVGVNSTTAYFPSSDSTGGNILRPANPPINGQLLVVDTTTPSSPTIVTKVAVPQAAYLTSVAVQGNIAVAVGDSTGIYDINSGFVGTLVIASFDISNPKAPVLLNQVTTQLGDKIGASIISLGSNTFAVGGTTNSGKGSLVLVDATNPSALRYLPYDAVFVASPQSANGNFFYSLSSNSLAIFQLAKINGPQISVSLQVPKTNGTSLVAGSFNQTPSTVTTGTTFDTYVWNQPSLDTITFNMNVTGVNPGDVRSIVNGGEVDFTVPSLGAGKLVLGPLDVLSQQIMSISPESRIFIRDGASADYAVTINNPTNAAQTFNLSVFGVPSTWVSIPASVPVAAGGSQTFTLTLTPDLNASTFGAGSQYTFTVEAVTAGGINASVEGNLGLGGAPDLGGDQLDRIFNVASSVSPQQLTIGRGDTGQFTVTLDNVGNIGGTINFFGPADLPSNWGITFTPTQAPFLQPGLSNSVNTVVSITVDPSTTPGPYVIHIPFVYFIGTNVFVTLPVTVNVPGAGVQGFIFPGLGDPTTTYTVRVINKGVSQDTFDLSVDGTLSEVAVLGSPSVTLAAGAFQDVTITLDPLAYLVPENALLEVTAVSESVAAVKATFAATVAVPGKRSVSASITPTPSNVSPVPGPAALLFTMSNTGDLDDTYSATISQTTGPVTASLTDLIGNQAQSIPVFEVTALGSAVIPVNAQIASAGSGSVTVTVTSLTDGTVKASATAVINGTAAQVPPIANAGAGGNILLNRLTLLDGSASHDPNTPALAVSYSWTLVTAPGGSAVTTGSIHFPSAAQAAFVPDVPGSYTFKLTVTNSVGPSSANVTFNAQLFPPVADPGKAQNAKTGGFVFLNGGASYDPNGLPLTFSWTFQSVAAGSTAILSNSTTPKPFYTCDVSGAYTLRLVVSNGTLQSAPAFVNVTCMTGNIAPNARAGVDRNAGVSQTVTLDGSASFDPDNGPQPLSYAWTFVSVPAGSHDGNAQIVNPSTSHPQFVPDVAGDYVLNLQVSDGVASSIDTVTAHAFVGDVAPNANAGADQFALPNATVGLNGSGSSDPDNGPLPLAFNWWFDGKPGASTATLVSPTTAQPHFTGDVTGYYIARLEATDGLRSGFANTLVTVAAVCDADANGVLNQTDLDLIAAANGSTALLHDPRDYNGDGVIDGTDLAACRAIIFPSTSVSIGTSPAGLSFTVNGTTYTSNQTLSFAPGATLNLSTTSPQTNGGTQFTFTGWSDGKAQSHSVVVGSSAITLTANFAVAYQLTEVLAGTGHGTVTPGSGGFYPSSSTLQLAASADACSIFAGWSANAPSGLVTFSSPQTVTATFTDTTAKVVGTLAVNGQATGQVTFTFAGDRRVTGTNHWRRTYTLTNNGSNLTNLALALDPPLTNVSSVANSVGQTLCAAPSGSSYLSVPNLASGKSVQITIEVVTPTPTQRWTGALRLLSGTP